MQAVLLEAFCAALAPNNGRYNCHVGAPLDNSH